MVEEKMLLTNNSRKMAGLPLHRKTNGKKRYYTRCEASETIGAFLDWCDGKTTPAKKGGRSNG